MKVSTEARPFADAVAAAAKALRRDSRSAITSGVLLEADTSGERPWLVVSGYDYETSVRIRVAAQVDEPGAVLVSGWLLAAVARRLADRPVSLSMGTASELTLECGAARFGLPLMDETAYPALPESPPVIGTVQANLFAAAVDRAKVAAGSDQTRPELTGILVRLDGLAGTVSLLASDMYRADLSEGLRFCPGDGEVADVAALVPAAVLADALDIIGATDEPLSIGLSAAGAAGTLLLQGPGRRVTTSLLSGALPEANLHRTMKRRPSAAMSVDRAAFAEVIERVSGVADSDFQFVDLDVESDQVTVSSADSEGRATGRESLACSLDGDPVTACYNARYLLDALKVMTTEQVWIGWSHSLKPAVVAEVTEDGPASRRHLVMPLRK